jgi:8-oxo-dGTP pyrophosphatase MutT (NUDIX family)
VKLPRPKLPRPKLPDPVRGGARRLLSRLTRRHPATGRPLQVGALPWRRGPDGGLDILLVTGRRSSRWIVPKGWPMRGRALAEAAALEAYEEAGVEGAIDVREIGRFDHVRNHPALGRMHATILLFPLAVARDLDAWPEKGQRNRRWFSREEAAKKVASPELARLILGFDAEADSVRLKRELRGEAAA